MRYIIIALILVGCNQNSGRKVQYLTNGYLCDSITSYNSGTVINCVNVMTGKTQRAIYNATNIVEVEVE